MEIKKYRYYGLPVVQLKNKELYAIALTEEKANKALKECVRKGLWYVSPEIISRYSFLALDRIRELQREKPKECNGEILNSIQDIESLVKNLIQDRGQFLGEYDGEESTLSNIFLGLNEAAEWHEITKWIEDKMARMDVHFERNSISLYRIE